MALGRGPRRGGRAAPVHPPHRGQPRLGARAAPRRGRPARGRARGSTRSSSRPTGGSAELGAELFGEGDRALTHCNTGALATGGIGTAGGVLRAAWEQGRLAQVWVDETRPLLQGARLTAWELRRAGIPHRVVADSAAGSLMARGRVDRVIVGADRIAANGDVANKVGTYPLAVLADRHGVPFYVAAPLSTIDPATPDGAEIPIEERDPAEVVGRRRRLQPRLRRDPRRAGHRDRDRGRGAGAALRRVDREGAGRVTGDPSSPPPASPRRRLTLRRSSLSRAARWCSASAAAATWWARWPPRRRVAPRRARRWWAASRGSGGRSTRIRARGRRPRSRGRGASRPGFSRRPGRRACATAACASPSRGWPSCSARRPFWWTPPSARAAIADGLAAAAAELERRPDRVRRRGRRRARPRRRAGPREPALRRDHARPPRAQLVCARRERRRRLPVLGGIFGVGCDGELTPAEVLERIAEVAEAGGFAGARGLTPAVAARLEQAVEAVPTEASAQALRCFRGAVGQTTIRQGRRTVELSPVGRAHVLLRRREGDLVGGPTGRGGGRRATTSRPRTRSFAPAASGPSSTTSVTHCTQFDRSSN